MRQRRYFAAARAFVCRLDVCWPFVYFIFLAVVLTITASITRTRVDNAMSETWHAVHDTHVRNVVGQLSTDFDKFIAVSMGYLTLHVKTRMRPGVEEVMGTLCSLLEAFDISQLIRVAAAGTFRLYALTACMRSQRNASSPSSTTWLGMASVDHIIDNVYYLNSTTYRFEEPRRAVIGVLSSPFNVTQLLTNLTLTDQVYNASYDRFSGAATSFDRELMWSFARRSPHLLHFTFPSMLLYRSGEIPADKDPSLFMRLIIDASRLLQIQSIDTTDTFASAIFTPDSLDLEDPLLMSNNWGQRAMNSTTIGMVLHGVNARYLRVSNVSNPLMRAALKHVNLKAFKQRGYSSSADFTYRGAPATVSAFYYNKYGSPCLPVVCVSAQRPVTAPFTRIMNICLIAATTLVAVETALFFLFVHRYLSAPLRRLTVMLINRLEPQSGSSSSTSDAVRPDDAYFQLSEVQTLIAAGISAMARMRQIDAFIPNAALLQRQLQQMDDDTLANPLSHGKMSLCSSVNDLTEQTLTVVYLRIRSAPDTLGAMTEKAGARHPLPHSTSSCLFPSPHALEDFIAVVHALCRIHHGAVHRLTPDGGIVHFGSAVRTHLFSYAATAAAAAVAATRSGCEIAPVEQLNMACVRREAARCARQDAQDALAFALELRRWLDHCRIQLLPDVRALVDTGMFGCGQYRPCGSDHTLSVAFGRDVSRDLGAVPAAIGVSVAMTEETAWRVRAAVHRSVGAFVSSGVRQLPVEALRTGRVGLNADVVILYEVLPGTVTGNAAWQHYQRCCFDGFGMMLRGDYPAALSAFTGVMNISDLEPGLLPRRLCREAATSRVTGGAVSTQVERLMRECERRIAAGISKGYYRERCVPMGIDAVLKGEVQSLAALSSAGRRERRGFDGSFASTAPAASPTPSATHTTSRPFPFSIAASCRPAQEKGRSQDDAEQANVGDERAEISVCKAETGLPDSVTDSNGVRWYLPRHREVVLYAKKVATAAPTETLVLGSAGTLCTLLRRTFALQTYQNTEEAEDAPLNVFHDGPSRAGRSPCIDAHLLLRERQLFASYAQWQHPDLLVPLCRVDLIDATAAVVLGCLPGSTLRALYRRFAFVKPVTVVRLHICILAALAHLHAKGAVHGAVSLDTAVVDANGCCRLVLQTDTTPDGHVVFASPRTCYVSPAMAAGLAPTPACDVFCYGLMCLEAVTRRPAWRWADDGVSAGSTPLPSARRANRDLFTLLKKGGSAFSAAVVEGRVVPALNRVDVPPVSTHVEAVARAALHRMLSYDPAVRPTAAELWELDQGVLHRQGVTIREGSKRGL